MAAGKTINGFGKRVLEKLLEIKKEILQKGQFIKTQIIQTYCL